MSPTWIVSCFLTVYLRFVIQVSSLCEENSGSVAGTLMNMTTHGVAGTVHILDDKRLLLKGFSYDGTGPAVYFYAGTDSTPSSSGTRLLDEQGSMNVLGAYNNQDLILTLPSTLTTTSIGWLSVWCAQFEVDFGSLVFSMYRIIPRPRSLSGLPLGGQQTQSGEVTIVNEKTMTVSNFTFAGTAPVTYFVGVFNGSGPVQMPLNYARLQHDSQRGADETVPILAQFQGEDVTLRLPTGTAVMDLRHLAVYCEQVSVTFSSITLPTRASYDTSPVPASCTAPQDGGGDGGGGGGSVKAKAIGL